MSAAGETRWGRRQSGCSASLFLLLAVRLVTNPRPLSNILPAIMIALIALAYLEEDGLVLSIGLLVGLMLLAADTAILWKLAEQIRWSDFHLAMLVSVSTTAPLVGQTK